MHQRIGSLVAVYPELDECAHDIQRAFEMLLECYETGHKVLVCGNGGSAADSNHIAGELMKGFVLRRPVCDDTKKVLVDRYGDRGEYLAAHLQEALAVIPLTNAVLMTAIANDVAPEVVFAQQVYGYGIPGDVLLALSTSGNSDNVNHALRVAKALGLGTIGLSGKTGGEMKGLCDVMICVPKERPFEVQERHLPIYHTICMLLEEAFFGI